MSAYLFICLLQCAYVVRNVSARLLQLVHLFLNLFIIEFNFFVLFICFLVYFKYKFYLLGVICLFSDEVNI